MRGHITPGGGNDTISNTKGKYGPRYLFSFGFLLSLGLLSLLSSLCCLFYNDSSLGLVLIAGVGDPGVDQLAPVGGHLLDQPLLCQLIQSTSGKRSSNLHTNVIKTNHQSLIFMTQLNNIIEMKDPVIFTLIHTFSLSETMLGVMSL